MEEYLDLYNISGVYIGEKILRSEKDNLSQNKFYLISALILENSSGELLIQKRSKDKNGEYALTAGHVKSGMDPLECMVSEVYEEIGLEILPNELDLIQKFRTDNQFWNVYYLKKDIDVKSFKFQETEVEEVLFCDKSKLMTLFKNSLFNKKHKGVVLDYLLKKNAK